MTQHPAPSETRTSALLLLGVAAVFVAIALFGGIVVTPWMSLVGLTAIPNIVSAVRMLRSAPSIPDGAAERDTGTA